MNNGDKHTFVLISGAWQGGWAWRDVIPMLRERGHAVSAPTLTGLGERHRSGNDTTTLSTHIEDVISHIEMEGLQQVTLVGASYGGMVVTGVLARIPEVIKSIIYLDAFVPENGKALVDYLPPEKRAILDAQVKTNRPIEPYPLEIFGVTEPSIVEFVTPRHVPHPWRTFYEPVVALTERPDIRVGYVHCTRHGPSPFGRFYEVMKKDPRVQTALIDTGHFCMMSEPRQTVDALISMA